MLEIPEDQSMDLVSEEADHTWGETAFNYARLFHEVCINSTIPRNCVKKVYVLSESDIEPFEESIHSFRDFRRRYRESELRRNFERHVQQVSITIETKIVGCQHYRHEWSDINNSIDRIYLEREPSNEYDTNAIQVCVKNSDGIYMPRACMGSEKVF